MSAVLEHPQRYRLSAQEYLRMAGTRVFRPDARLELIEGEIIEMAPIGSPHAGAVNTLTRLFVELAGKRALVSVQNPLIVDGHSVPQPDLALLKPRADNYAATHPAAGDVLLMVEVADSTLAFDTHTKVPLYARAGIAEVWVVAVKKQVIRIYRDPAPRGYRTHLEVSGKQKASVLLLPKVAFAVSEVFPS